MLKAALKYHQKGYKIIFTTEEKMPVCSWGHFRKKQTEDDIRKMYKDNESKIYGLAVLCVDGVEVVDIDEKYSLDGQLKEDFLSKVVEYIGEENDEKLTITLTQSNGAHLIYRTNIIEGNQKLACRATTNKEKGTSRVLIETRAKGGYFIVPPTPGYTFFQISDSGEFAPQISNDWRNEIINIARSFDEIDTHFVQKNREHTPTNVLGANKSTIEDFNENHTPHDILQSNGWVYNRTKGDDDYFYRPGKTKGSPSAGCNTKLNLAFIFTSSTTLEHFKAYNPFQLYAHFEHNGDYKEAAKALYRSGFGSRMSKTQDSYSQKVTAITQAGDIERATSKNKMDEIWESRFSILKKPAHIDYNLTYRDKLGQNYDIAAFGDLVTICGAAKSRKSSLGSSIVASSISLRINEVLGFTLDNKGRNVVYIDTEQSDPEFYKVQERMYRQARISVDPANYYAFRVGEYDKIDRLAFFAYVIEKVKDVGLIFIDGIVDFCEDYNDQVGSRKLVDYLKKVAIKNNIMVISILHNARSTGDARGHLGTELINKSKAVIQVTKNEEGDFSTVNFKYLREREPQDFDFGHDGNGSLVLI